MTESELMRLAVETAPWAGLAFLIVRELRRAAVEVCSHLRDFQPVIVLRVESEEPAPFIEPTSGSEVRPHGLA